MIWLKICASMNKADSIYIAGSTGMVGSSIVRLLESEGYENIITSTSKDIDLRNQEETFAFFERNKFDYVFLTAARVGGILENSIKKAEFIYDNLQIQNNVIHYSFKTNVKKLLFLGSSCVYPKYPKIPINEGELLSGKLEETNDAYAIAKIAGIMMCQSYRQQYNFNAISLMPTNLYGYNDNFDLNSSHVIPALLRKFIYAKENNLDEVVCWGSGKPMREFLFVDDLAEACLFSMKNYSEEEHLNVGTGKDISIDELVKLIKDIVGFEGEVRWDSTKPDGTMRKVLDVKKIKSLGWESRVSLRDGLKRTIKWYLNNKKQSG